jgi:hypothetical protein
MKASTIKQKEKIRQKHIFLDVKRQLHVSTTSGSNHENVR